MSLNTTSQTQQAITALDTLVKQNGALIEALGPQQSLVAECYEIAQEKGLTIPSPTQQTLANLPDTMETITKAYQGRMYIGSFNYTQFPQNSDYLIQDFKGVVFIGDIPRLFRAPAYIQKAYNICAPQPTSIVDLCYENEIIEVIDLVDVNGQYLTTIGTPIERAKNMYSIVGDRTIEEVIEGNIKVLDGVNIAINFGGTNAGKLNRASLRAVINGLADRNGQETLNLNTNNLTVLTAEDIAIATAKNWSVS